MPLRTPADRVTARTVAAVVLGLTLVGCRDDRGLITFRPPPGTTSKYTITVTTTTTVELPGNPTPPSSTPVVLHVEQLVLPNAPNGEIRVQLKLTPTGAATRTYIARFDRAAQLTDIERVEGIPTEALGDLGLTEIFPAAAGAPPARRLRPGDTWTIAESLHLPGSAEAIPLNGRGKLVELGVIDGHRAATVQSSTSLPLTTTVTSRGGLQHLDGTQTTDLDASYDVTDGSIVSGEARTVGRFSLVLSPPPGTSGEPLRGSLTVEVRTRIERR